METFQGSPWAPPAENCCDSQESSCNSQECSCSSERSRSVQRGSSKGGQIFSACWGKEEKGSHRTVVSASPRRCSPLSGSGQGGCLLQELKAMSLQCRCKACSCKGRSQGHQKTHAYARIPTAPSLAWEQRQGKRGRGFLCPGTPSSGSSRSSEKSLRAGCLSGQQVGPSGSNPALVQNKQLIISPWCSR